MILRLVESQSSPGRAPVDMPTTIVGALAALAIAIGCLNSVLRGPTQQELVAKADPIC